MTEIQTVNFSRDLTAPILVAERFHRSVGARIADGLWTGLVMSVILSLAMSSLLIALSLVYVFIEPAKLWSQLRFVALFVPFSFAFVAVIGFPQALYNAVRQNRPRLIAGTADEIHLVYARREVSLPVSRCTFRIGGRWSTDPAGAIFHQQPFLVITSLPAVVSRPDEVTIFFCGLNPTSLEDWKAYLRAVSIGPGPKRIWVPVVAGLITGFLVGLAGGLAVHQIVNAFGGGRLLCLASALLVAADGAVAGGLIAYVRAVDMQTLEAAQFARKGEFGLYALKAAAMGVFFSRGISVWTSLTFATVNAAFGAGLGIVLASLARSRERSSPPQDGPEGIQPADRRFEPDGEGSRGA